MTEEIIIDYKKECSNLLAEKNALLCRYEEIREQLKQAENTVNECHKYLAELEDKIERLEQENKDLKKQIESDKGLITIGGKQQYEYLQRIDELKKTVENQKLEYEELQCDLSEVENACGCYQSENAELKQENEELKELNKKICEDWEKEIKVYWNALEEIREIEILAYYPKGVPEEPLSQRDFILGAINEYEKRRIKILNKINEVLNE